MDDTRGLRPRLLFAKRRLDDLSLLAGGDFGKVQEAERLQPLQEFFFHLVGAIEFIAQTINDIKKLGLNEEYLTPRRVSLKLPEDDRIRIILSQLCPTTRGYHLPNDPYSEDGSFFRIILLRFREKSEGRSESESRILPPPLISDP